MRFNPCGRVALFSLFVFGCSGEPPPAFVMRSIDPPAGAGSLAPNLATGDDGRIYLSWIEPADDESHRLRFSVREADGWSEPRTVAEGPGWFVNWADFPSMAALADGTLAAHWLVRSADTPYAYDVHLALSNDGGENWTPSILPHRDGTPTEHGFVSIVPRDASSFRVIWLDGRETAEGAHDHDEGAAGRMTLRSTTIDRAGRLGEELLLDSSVCDCCQTDAIRTTAGEVVVAYRDRSAEEVRDIAIARVDAADPDQPKRLHPDEWRIAACPVNGPAIAGNRSSTVCAWFAAPGGDRRVQLAFSSDDGRTFGEPIRIGGANALGRVDVAALDDGSAVVSWLEDSQIRLQRVDRDGSSGEMHVITETSEERASGVPRLARSDGGIVVAWTEPGEPSRVRAVVIEALP